MDPNGVFIIVLTASLLLVVFIGFFIATIIQNQKRFIKVQKEKLLESERLQEVLRDRPRQIIQAQEEERKRVARDLHDGASQVLTSIIYKLYAIKARLSGGQEHSASREVTDLATQSATDLEHALEELKRIAHNLRPKILDELGFDASVRSLLNYFQERTHITCTYLGEKEPGQTAMPQEVALGLFRIIQEALNNVERHSAATSITIKSQIESSQFLLTIADNGKGMDTMKLLAGPQGKEGRHQGMGILSMKERATLLGGSCALSSNSPHGTVITVTIPNRE